MGSTAAGLAAFGIGFLAYIWLTPDSGPANARLRAQASNVSLDSIGPKLVDHGRMRLASLEAANNSSFAFEQGADQTGSLSARASFGERFAFDRSSAPWSLQASQASLQTSASFDDRFGAEVFAPS